ncbi:MAG: glycosyl hydrolase [Gemmatimonadetes bacterium]|nr:glycosyl hydrolase [Gemmatimonadota bacterium]
MTRRVLTVAALAAWIALSSVAAGRAHETTEAAPSLHQEPDALLAGIQHAVCYSGFRKGQHPDRGDGAVNPTDEQILEDLRMLTRDGNFRLIRVYDSGANSEAVLRLIRKHGFDMKVMLGAWLSAEMSNPECPWTPDPYPEEVLQANRKHNALEIERAVRLAREYPKIVCSVAVGNEALVNWNDHMVPVERVIDYVRTVKKAVPQPVTVADNYVWWAEEGHELAAELDFVSVHIYPVWENRDIDEGISYGAENMQRVRDALPESRLVITEAGWASTASEFGERASQEKQLAYYNDVFRWSAERNITLFFFEAFDESWKGNPDNPAGAEKHWGLFTEDRRPKLVMQELYPDLPPAAATE